MNYHLLQINPLPFHYDALRRAGQHQGVQQDAAGILGVDTARPVASRALGRRIARFLAWLSAAPRRARDQAELSRFNARELADIGLTSGDIGRIHDPAFVADYEAGRPQPTGLKGR